MHQADALAWLRENPLPPGHAALTSLPDSSELRRLPFAAWRTWFTDAAAQTLRSTPACSAAVFFQTDTKRDGLWVDKAQLVAEGARGAGGHLLWHKIVCRAPAGRATGGRPGYAHLLCWSRELRDAVDRATPDVLPELGAMTWPRAIGLAAARFAVGWLRDHAGATAIVDPFCGVGTVLAVANAMGLGAIGVEVSPGRAQRARELRS